MKGHAARARDASGHDEDGRCAGIGQASTFLPVKNRGSELGPVAVKTGRIQMFPNRP